MAKILLFSILLVLVYQFDEVVRGVLHIMRRVLKQKLHYVIRDSDHYVGTALTIATMPLLLYSIMASEQELIVKLIWLACVYLGFAVAAAGLGYFLGQIRHLKTREGYDLAFSALGVVGGLFHPSLNMVPWHAGRERMTFAKLAFLLSIPAVLAALFKIYYDQSMYQAELSEYLDVLIIVLIGGVFINITISALEKYLKTNNLGIFSYFRIAAGLGVAFYLIY